MGHLTLVDLDARVTALFAQHPDLVALNGNALNDPRVTIVSQDAWKFVETSTEVFDVVIADLPDPKSLALSKLYSREFYAMLADRISAQGVIAVQAGSPLFAREGYGSVVHTLAGTRNPVRPGAGLSVIPYHAYVPSFGDWGFVLATPQVLAPRALTLPAGLRYLTAAVWQEAQVFGADTAELPAAVNSLQSHALVGYYNAGWDYWFR